MRRTSWIDRLVVCKECKHVAKDQERHQQHLKEARHINTLRNMAYRQDKRQELLCYHNIKVMFLVKIVFQSCTNKDQYNIIHQLILIWKMGQKKEKLPRKNMSLTERFCSIIFSYVVLVVLCRFCTRFCQALFQLLVQVRVEYRQLVRKGMIGLKYCRSSKPNIIK